MPAINVSKDIGREIGIDTIFPDVGEEQKSIRTFHWIAQIELKYIHLKKNRLYFLYVLNSAQK